MNQKCINCKYFEERSFFCRKNPPCSIVVKSDNADPKILTMFPKIPLPSVDFCWQFDEKTRG